ncbi:hypothetical protein [Hymenobacter rigui]|uniref:Uncharacterized protein n=1 Tax=Hymenobacter rigui TaxID=334424 RepID=A0A3R9N7L0_9BACT|nr:hypothetical protein [Hymenobacter rigui]RSK50132.1 hypothetical protein EI291_05625 [Hymenobacter rigui]
MSINLPTLPDTFFLYAVRLLVALLLWLWLRKELTPKRVLSIWESEGVLSSRQILAWVVALFGLFMRAADRIDNDALSHCFECSFILFGIGGAVQLASKIKPATTVNAKVDAENLNVGTTPEAEQPAPKVY